jgi:hypothetical protein
MSIRVLTSALVMSTYAAIAAAQTPPATQPPAPSQASKANSVTVQGCLQRDASPSSATPGTVGTSGSATTAFVLANAMKPADSAGATAGAATAARPDPSAGAIASTYRLDAEDSKLGPHVGHKVEITGTVAENTSAPSASASASASNIPKLKVDSVKMIAATCTP